MSRESALQYVTSDPDYKKATHIIIVCDTFDHEDYPVLAFGERDLEKKKSEYNNKNMQRVMEVIKLPTKKAKKRS